MLKQIGLNVVGAGEHRSGWPYCLKSLKPIFNPKSPILLDDFVERTFLYDKKWHADHAVHKQPWVGVMHHPPDMPGWYMPNLHLQKLRQNQRFLESEPHLRMIISMGDNLTNWCRKMWPNMPVVTVRHPTGRAIVNWSPERFARNKKRRLVQIGWFLRNTQAIYQAEVPDWLTKTHLCQKKEWIEYAHWLCGKTYATLEPSRQNIGEVEQITHFDDTSYDVMLAENVVLMEVLSAVANNTVVECISRNTPICINRHPGPEYYLGVDYPLFYTHFSQIPQLLTTERVMAAHNYLCRMDKWWIRGGMFCEQIATACRQHIPECRNFNSPVFATAPTEFTI